jgi:hypothetical protein
MWAKRDKWLNRIRVSSQGKAKVTSSNIDFNVYKFII